MIVNITCTWLGVGAIEPIVAEKLPEVLGYI